MKLTELKGIGEKTAGAFNRLGILSAEDLVRYYPRDYEELEMPVELYKLEAGRIQAVEGVLTKAAAVNRFNGMTIVNVYLSDMTGRLQISWYNSPFIKNALHVGEKYVFRGRVYEKAGRMIMSQPKIYAAEEYRRSYEGRLLPVYSLTKGVSNKLMIKACTEALQSLGGVPEYLPESVLKSTDLPSEQEASIRMHFPRSKEELEAARRRIVFDEFFMFILAGVTVNAEALKSVSAYKCRPDLRMIRFIASLPFALTAAQKKAYGEITKDLSSGRVMNRLVEGDVGSGKTIVAVLAMLSMAFNGHQAVIMAPTAVLASQHYENISRMLQRMYDDEEMQSKLADGSEKALQVVLLTGSMTAAERRKAYAQIKNHEADLIVGTHAVFQEGVEYADLGLVVTDEQHRFGVGQREAIFSKGNMPHTLIMSATPIPRTLAITLYSGMAMSVIDARPEGRKAIKNCVVGPDYRKTAYKFIYEEIKKGRQAYIICPSIEKDEEEEDTPTDNLENVAEYTEKLRKLFPENIRIASLHGRMKNDEKEAVMSAFKAHETDILISTTVIEVGVDVPNSTVMMIENAERYGLAQLHQLRGRVGRGSEQSYCIMINTSDTEKAADRLNILNQSNDGFRIAEEDLRLRGPGDIFGLRQSGDLNFSVADIYADADVMKQASDAVKAMLTADPELSGTGHTVLKRKLESYLKRGYTV